MKKRSLISFVNRKKSTDNSETHTLQLYKNIKIKSNSSSQRTNDYDIRIIIWQLDTKLAQELISK